MADFIHLRVKRQDGPQAQSRWEDFKIPYKPNMNIISVLMEIQKSPVNARGEKTTPVIWECNCLEEVCGACTMIINGKARQACTALIDQLPQTIELRPLSKFTLIRDLMVDRQIMFDNLKKVKAWIPIDGSYDLGPGPRLAGKVQEWAYELSKCMTCGCCMEACPQVNSRSNFIGPAAISQVRLFNAHPTGEMNKEERLEALLGNGGITDCGNSQNCVRACPKEIPLTTSIADINKETTLYGIRRWLRR
ncbi:MAG: succinate dehydrogenase iron-sulfur subunit [Clostridia bacterium]|nr:succinate dehydrogenase iron-sulfur subunit [Clostridia bacterium]